jgi:hypothetical protein
MHNHLHVKYPLSLSHFDELNFLDCFEKYSNVKLYEDPFNVSQVVSCGWTDRRDKISIYFFCNFAKKPKNVE